MFALTVAVKHRTGEIIIYQGTLISVPSIYTDEDWLSVLFECPSGWHEDNYGYHSFLRHDFEGHLIAVPGIWIAGDQPTEIFPETKFQFAREQIEAFVDGIVEFEKYSLQRATQDANMLVHDLRSISNSIYNSAVEAERVLDFGNYDLAKTRIRNILAAQSILRIRTDILDFVGNPGAAFEKGREIEVYRKVDKVCRALKPDAADREVGIDFGGECFRSAFGPDVFEIVPFLLIENAFKYAPKRSTVNVLVNETVEGNILLEVESYGPLITVNEREEIFEKGVRGRNAKKAVVEGSGLGLFLVRTIVEDAFEGSVNVEQDDNEAFFLNGLDYYTTNFWVEIPASTGEHERARRSQRLSSRFSFGD